MEVINIYRKNTSNIGDHFTTPTKYFDYLKNIQTLDIDELPLTEFSKRIEGKTIILGGGGFVSQDYFKDYIGTLLGAKTRSLIGWSIGHNNHGGCDIFYDKKFIERFDLLGVRDSENDLEWVPCPSCMNNAFDKKFEIKNEIIIYEHKNFPMKGVSDSFPRMKNNDSFEDVINFLGSAELVVTNSYHGAYWATLLNKKVVVLQPFSSKFFGFRYPLIVANNFNDIKGIKNVPTYPQALIESREANKKFSDRVHEKI